MDEYKEYFLLGIMAAILYSNNASGRSVEDAVKLAAKIKKRAEDFIDNGEKA